MKELKNASIYQEVEAYIYDIPKFTKKNSLSHTRELLETLGDPAMRIPMIHVAGTNGKGSVCAFLEALFRERGMKTGLFTSPHLVSMCERIRINGTSVTQESFCEAFQCVHRTVENRKQKDPAFPYPTFFETLFLMAMVLFEKEKPDIIILETGLGGRKDATNVVRPAVTVITQIGLDHCEYLGDTKEKIAREKAGIIKEGIPVVFAGREKETADVIKRVAAQKNAAVFPIGEKEYHVEKSNQKYVDFSFHSRYYNYVGFTLPTSAVYQAENASLALRAYEVFWGDETGTPEKMQSGLSKMKWAGRMEEVLPRIYVDGAHNTDGILAFLDTVRSHGNQADNYLIFAVMADKDYREMIRLLAQSGLFKEILITGLTEKRAASVCEMEKIFVGFTEGTVCVFEKPVDALRYVSNRKDKEDYLYVAGSLYLAGDMLPLLKENFYDQF